jgi:signal transduction histidine kinase
MVQCYPGKLNQAFLNILSNAIDSIEKEGSIIIRTHYEDGKVVVQIEDSGKGIARKLSIKYSIRFLPPRLLGKEWV